MNSKMTKIINELIDFGNCHSNDIRCKHIAIAFKNKKRISSPCINKWKYMESQHAEVGAISDLFYKCCRGANVTFESFKQSLHTQKPYVLHVKT
jgi:hypothetical protein